MTLDHLGRLDIIMVKELIGGFGHGTAATGFGQPGARILSQGMGQLDQPLSASRVAKVGVGKFIDGPVGRIGEVAYARLLERQVALGVMMENLLQNTSSRSKFKHVSDCQLIR